MWHFQICYSLVHRSLRTIWLQLLPLLLTFCNSLTGQKTHRGGLGLGGLVYEEAHPCIRILHIHPVTQ